MSVMRVCVVGAGAAGLVAARVVAAQSDHFQSPVVFEQSASLGGTWVYTDRVGTDANGLPIHSSMYRNLRTNLPKEVMGFPDFPFQPSSCDGKSFIFHDEVLDYLRDYASEYKLQQFIKFSTRVESVSPSRPGDPESGWRVSTHNYKTHEDCEHEFDAIIVCNGHYSVPYLPDLPGRDKFRGPISHSHDYRVPDPFTGKRVLVLGGRASGIDISLELCSVAKQVYMAHNNPPYPSALPENMCQTTGVDRLTPDGVVLSDGQHLDVDEILLCTGYEFVFPFLRPECGVSVVDRQVQPLYKHVIHTGYNRMAFIGLNTLVLPFPLFHKQVEFFLASLTGALSLPSRSEMDADTERDLTARREMDLPHRYAHLLGPMQWDYMHELADLAGTERVPEVIADLYQEVHTCRATDVRGYKSRVYRLLDSERFAEVTEERRGQSRL